MATAPVVAAPVHESFLQKLAGGEQKTVRVLEAIAKDAEKGLEFAQKYLPEAASLAEVIYPPSAAVDAGVISATDLIQKAVANAEQQYAATTPSTATDSQKFATVLTLSESAVTTLLAQAGIKADTTYVTDLINAVVAILKVQIVPPAVAAA